MSLSDQQLAEIRYTTVARKIEAEQQLELVVLAGMDLWLNRVACLIVGQPGPALVADGEPVEPWVDRIEAATAAANEWLLFLDVGLVPQVGALFGEAFNQARRGDEFNPYRWQQDYMQEVFDRLKIWPADAFELMRPDLVEALSDAATIDQVMNQIGDTLGISAESRRHRARIGDLDAALKDPDLTPAQRAALIGRRAREWGAHDASLDDWEWKARRIARTEVQGAMEGGNTAAARAWSAATGEQMWKQWLATEDGRTRHSHALASGQIVRLDEKFTVGGAHLDHPGEAGGPAHEVIQCRCTTLNLDADDVQDELQGKRGSIGEVRPGGSRMGPDDPDIVAQKITEQKAAEQVARAVKKESAWVQRAFPDKPLFIVRPESPVADPRPHPAGQRSFDEVSPYLARSDPFRFCRDDKERALLMELRKSKPYVSVQPYGNKKTADYALKKERKLIEAKTMDPFDPQRVLEGRGGEPYDANAIARNIERAGKQGRAALIDGRVDGCVSLQVARAGVEKILSSKRGAYVDEITVLTEEGVVYWSRGH